MKDAVGSTMLVYIVIIVIGIVGSILVATNMYTSAYKAKNNIISTIDRHYMIHSDGSTCFDDDTCITSIESTLKNMGYHVKGISCDGKIFNKVNEKSKKNADGEYLVSVEQVYEDSEARGYCVYKVSNISDNDYYYTVVTFSHLNVLGIDSLFSTPVYGETRTFYNS